MKTGISTFSHNNIFASGATNREHITSILLYCVVKEHFITQQCKCDRDITAIKWHVYLVRARSVYLDEEYDSSEDCGFLRLVGSVRIHGSAHSSPRGSRVRSRTSLRCSRGIGRSISARWTITSRDERTRLCIGAFSQYEFDRNPHYFVSSKRQIVAARTMNPRANGIVLAAFFQGHFTKLNESLFHEHWGVSW